MLSELENDSVLASWLRLSLGRLSKRSVRSHKVPVRLPYYKELDQLYETRKRHLVWVRQPLVLISQIQRSGGTLLSRLLDMHPELHTHPHEIHIGYPHKSKWPVLDLNEPPSHWYAILYEQRATQHFLYGYYKFGKAKGLEPQRRPFIIPPTIQRRLFLHCVQLLEPQTVRGVLDCYMTSYFNAWLDNHNLYFTPKKYVTGFTARMAVYPKSIQGFFDAYPDGRLISVLREPKSWFASARIHKPRRWTCPMSASRDWLRSTEAILAYRRRYGNRVYLVSFESIIHHTEGIMRQLCNYLGINFEPCLLKPTFNGLSVRSNSSFPVTGLGIEREPAKRSTHLSPSDATLIDRETRKTYEEALSLIEGCTTVDSSEKSMS